MPVHSKYTRLAFPALLFSLAYSSFALAQTECDALADPNNLLCTEYCETLDCDALPRKPPKALKQACSAAKDDLLAGIIPTLTTVDCSDIDQDGVLNSADLCPEVGNPDQADTDGDGVADACGNCPGISNADQMDTDGDGIGVACTDGEQPVAATCTCFSSGLARLVIQSHQGGFDGLVLSSEYCISQPGILG